MRSQPDFDPPARRPPRVPGIPDQTGAIYLPGDDTARQAPVSALLLLILSIVVGGLYAWTFWPRLAHFDWVAALTLKTSVLAVVGGIMLALGGLLLIRFGLVWSVRAGSILAALAMTRPLLDATLSDVGDPGAAGVTFVLSAGPALITLGISFSGSLRHWRRTRFTPERIGRPPN